MLEARRSAQLSFGDGLINEAVEDLWEPWMRQADKALDDDALLTLIERELMKRCKKSKTRGRKATPVEVVLRMMLLKHVRDWSFETLSREVRSNLVYRQFTRIGAEKVPDDKTMGNLARQLGPDLIAKLHDRIVRIAIENNVTAGKKMRVDTTVVETNIHYPTDSTLLGDGVRVLTRLMQKVTKAAGQAGTKFRNRTRAVRLKVLAIARASRNRTQAGQEKMKDAYVQLLAAAGRVVGDAKKFSREIAARVKKGNRKALQNIKRQLDQMIPRMQQVLRQTRERVVCGNTKAADKIFSLFEPHTEIIRKGKTNKPNEFGQLLLLQEAENQIIIGYQVCEQRPADSMLFGPALDKHVEVFGKAPKEAAADAGFFSAANENMAEEMGVKRVSIPSHSTKSQTRKERQKKPWFKELQRWRTGCEGRISVVKRRHGLERSRYKGANGMKRWVGLGVIADNLIQIGTQLAKQALSS